MLQEHCEVPGKKARCEDLACELQTAVTQFTRATQLTLDLPRLE
jgi:hypothetical protein